MSSAVNETMRSMLPSLDIRNTVSTSKEPAASVEMGAIKSVELTSPVAAEAPMNLATAMTARRNEIVLAQATTNEVEAIAQPYMAYKPPLGFCVFSFCLIANRKFFSRCCYFNGKQFAQTGAEMGTALCSCFRYISLLSCPLCIDYVLIYFNNLDWTRQRSSFRFIYYL